MFQLTLKSRNGKTGPIPVSTSPEWTCPPSCPFKGNGCYGDCGPVKLVWEKVTNGKMGVSYEEFCEAIEQLPDGQLWRHNQVGDLVGYEYQPCEIDVVDLKRLVKANRGRRGYTYCHYPVLTGDVVTNSNTTAVRVAAYNRGLISYANENGFTINLSANNLDHADALHDLEIAPVAVVLPHDTNPKAKLRTPAGNKVTMCPADKAKGITCETCKLCAVPNKDRILGLIAHGVKKKAASAVAEGK